MPFFRIDFGLLEDFNRGSSRGFDVGLLEELNGTSTFTSTFRMDKEIFPAHFRGYILVAFVFISMNSKRSSPTLKSRDSQRTDQE